MKLPTNEQIIEWYKELDTPENIVDHVKAVAELAVSIAKKLKQSGEDINVELVEKAALVHDLDKWMCINDKSIDHGFKTEEILKEKGYPELGFYARQHRGDLMTKGYNTWEEKVVAYADKRVIDDKVVTLKDRFDLINKRYPPEDWDKRNEQIRLFFELEKEILSIIGRI